MLEDVRRASRLPAVHVLYGGSCAIRDTLHMDIAMHMAGAIGICNRRHEMFMHDLATSEPTVFIPITDDAALANYATSAMVIREPPQNVYDYIRVYFSTVGKPCGMTSRESVLRLSERALVDWLIGGNPIMHHDMNTLRNMGAIFALGSTGRQPSRAIINSFIHVMCKRIVSAFPTCYEIPVMPYVTNMGRLTRMCAMMMSPGDIGMFESQHARADVPSESIRRILMFGLQSAVTVAYEEARTIGVADVYLATEDACRTKLTPFYDYPGCMEAGVRRMGAWVIGSF
jgi:hypothetical protein